MHLLRRNPEIKPSDPLLTTRWFDIASMLLWLVYGIWGIAAFLEQLPSFAIVGAPHWYGSIWALILGLTSLVAALGAVSMFFRLPRITQVTKKRIERDALAVFCALIFIIHVIYTIAFLSGHSPYFAAVFLTFSYYIMPLFRIFHLNRRIRVVSGRLP